QAQGLLFGGEHNAGAIMQGPRQAQEIKVNKVRTQKKGLSYAEAVKRVERREERTRRQAEVEQPREEAERHTPIFMDREQFLAFLLV
ncbi:hypothetical protein, partial [Nocardioides malaquae]|uniref:hypothetical protein n=1 Tax=Nocardioides malaquae TaxID=2773426 RepID=UPI001D0D53E6